ncbi:MAG: DUF1684 domain-containing protein [Sphingobacteriales bacterium]|nr:MAG: DUF1684 domain-containing protein [Sphingobacteriales bacterium]
MNKAFFALSIYVIFSLCSCEMESSDPFIRREEAKRFSRDSFFKLSPESPIDPAERKYFFNLLFFEPKQEYLVKAEFKESSPPQSVYIQESDEHEREFLRMGKLYFTLLGKPCSLSVYQDARFIHDTTVNKTLFLPFSDETNGKESYHAGRYLDIHYTDGMKEIELDFNDAYNPYCAYTDYYKCPLPPAENHIPFRIEAGEKAYAENK